MFDGDGSSAFLGDEASFQKKEVELAKKLVSTESTQALIHDFGICSHLYVCERSSKLSGVSGTRWKF